MGRRPTIESIEDWVQGLPEFVWSLAKRHYAKLGPGTVVIEADSVKDNVLCTYLPLAALDKAFEKPFVDAVCAHISEYDPETQFVVSMSGNGRTLGCAICKGLSSRN